MIPEVTQHLENSIHSKSLRDNTGGKQRFGKPINLQIKFHFKLNSQTFVFLISIFNIPCQATLKALDSTPETA